MDTPPPPPPYPGAWGEPNALIDWCEKNYATSGFVAEFWNTLSNLAFVYIGVLVYRKAWHLRLSPRFQLIGFSIILTGICSGFFHASLWYSAWKSDEIAETFTVILLLHNSMGNLERSSDETVISRACGHSLAAASLLVWFPLVFCEVHLVTIILVASYYMHRGMEKAPARPDFLLLWKSLGLAAFAFACWLVDRLACETMHSLPVNLQLHGWWHVFASFALHEASCVVMATSRPKGPSVAVYEGWGLTHLVPVYADVG